MRTCVRGQFSAAALLLTLCLLAMLVGCGNSNLTFPGDIVPTSTPGGPTETPGLGAATPTETPQPAGVCAPSGADCIVGPDCCSGQCVSGDGTLSSCA